MKNLLKKFGVMIASLMLVMTTFAVPSFAVSGDSTTLKVEDVESTATVKAYQVVKRDGNGNWIMDSAYGEQKKLTAAGALAGEGEEGTVTWVVKGTLIPYSFEDPSSKALTALALIAQAKEAAENKKTPPATAATFTFDKPAGTEKAFTKTITKQTNRTELGSYLVLVEPADPGTVYNPMIVSVNPEADGIKTDDNGNKVSANNTDVHAKKSTITFEKVVERKANAGAETNKDNNSVTGDALDDDPTGDDISATDGDGDGTDDGNKGDTAGSTGGTVTLDSTSGKVTYSADTEGKEAVFDDVAFRINTKLPKYEANYFKKSEEGKYPEKIGDFYNPKFIVNDALSTGLTFKSGSITVKVAGVNDDKAIAATTTLDGANDTYKVEYDKDGKDFVITFAPAFLEKNGGKAVEICYYATVNKNHGVNFKEETNTAELHYNNKPGQNASKMDEKETYHYTFTINGDLEGQREDIEENREVIKIGLDDNGKEITQVMNETTAVTKTGWRPLEGVEFILYKANAKGDAPDTDKKVKDVITDRDGILRGMNQIDAGVYYLVETSVGPNTEFAKNTTPIKIEILPTLDNKGRMTSYQVKVNSILVGDYVKDWNDPNPKAESVLHGQKNVVNKKTGETTYNYTDNDSEAADIVNNKVGTLPSTGGMGTILFTVGGIVIMALALFLLFGSRKKQHQK